MTPIKKGAAARLGLRKPLSARRRRSAFSVTFDEATAGVRMDAWSAALADAGFSVGRHWPIELLRNGCRAPWTTQRRP